MITLSLSSEAQELIRSFSTMPQRISVAMAAALDHENQNTIGYITENKLHQRGPTTLGVRSRRLRESILSTTPRISGTSISSSIGTNVKYAAVHEFGTGPFTIRPKNKKALRFSVGGAFHFAKQVRHPGFPARHMIRSGIEERMENYNKALSEAVTTALQS
jgi:phage gpG-like protein